MKNFGIKLSTLFFILLNTKFIYAQFTTRTIIDSSAIGITEIITPDINNDGFKDIVISQKYTINNKVSYYLNLGNSQFSTQQIVDSNIYNPSSIAYADFDNNGWVDIVSVSTTLNNGNVYINFNNNGNFSAKQIIDSNLYVPIDVKTIDINNDNHVDIIAIGDTALVLYLNNNSNFNKQVIPTPTISSEYYDLFVSDIDNDNNVDVIIGGVRTLILKNTNGTFSFDSARTFSIDNNSLVTLVNLADFDNDGDNDLIINGNSGNDLRWYENDGSGFFNLHQIIDSNITQIVSVSLNDLDNDGDIDILTTYPQNGNVVWFPNDGNGNFINKNIIYQGNIPFTKIVCSNDMNNDNLTDIIWAEELSIHFNNLALSTNNLNSNFQVTLYPNPTGKNTNITSNFNAQLFIYNNVGQIVHKTKIKKGINNLITNLPPQVYTLLFLSSDNKKYFKKLIICE